MNFDFDNIVASLGELGIQVKNPDGTFRNFSDVILVSIETITQESTGLALCERQERIISSLG